ncbi:MAG: STAS domain-containing protein [Anaerolineales bacterium]
MILVSSPQPDIWAIAPQGRIDSAAAGALQDALDGLLSEGRSRIVIDFADVSYMASAGLRVLILSLRRARKLGGDMHLAAIPSGVGEVLSMAGLETMFTFQPTVAEAIRSLQSPAG